MSLPTATVREYAPVFRQRLKRPRTHVRTNGSVRPFTILCFVMRWVGSISFRLSNTRHEIISFSFSIDSKRIRISSRFPLRLNGFAVVSMKTPSKDNGTDLGGTSNGAFWGSCLKPIAINRRHAFVCRVHSYTFRSRVYLIVSKNTSSS